MLPALLTTAYLVAFLGSCVVSHALWNRLLLARSRQPRPPQGPALLVVMANVLVFLIAAVWTDFGPGSQPARLVYLGICMACIGQCYWSLICISESGRRFRIARLVHTGQAVTPGDIRRLYNKDLIIEERLKRLIAWGEVREEGPRVICVRKKMYWASVAVHFWARVLGFDWFNRAQASSE